VFGRYVESGVRWSFALVRLAVAVKMFTHLLYFIKKIYKFCTFSVICNDNAEINFITV
jgi:hypothetical protein